MRAVYLMLAAVIALTVLVATAMTVAMCGAGALLAPMSDGLCAASDQPRDVFRAVLIWAGVPALALVVGLRLIAKGRS